MRINDIIKCELCNGNGVGVSLFVQGCPLHCEGCFNKELWEFNGGKEFETKTKVLLLDLLAPTYVKRFSLLGGEPLAPENVKGSLNLLRSVRNSYNNTKEIWLYTGYTLEELNDRCDRDIAEILSMVDVLVDGRFNYARKDLSLAFRGSTNQRIIDMKATLEQRKIVLKNY